MNKMNKKFRNIVIPHIVCAFISGIICALALEHSAISIAGENDPPIMVAYIVFNLVAIGCVVLAWFTVPTLISDIEGKYNLELQRALAEQHAEQNKGGSSPVSCLEIKFEDGYARTIHHEINELDKYNPGRGWAKFLHWYFGRPESNYFMLEFRGPGSRIYTNELIKRKDIKGFNLYTTYLEAQKKSST